MDFINRSFSGAFKTLLIIVAVFVIIRVIPLLVVVGFIAWTGFKGFKYFKNRGVKKSRKYENMDVKASMNDDEDPFDFTDKNVVDVEYEEIKK